MFVDEATVYATGGQGGNGCLSFRREKFVPRGGPDGGDGGHGGSVILRADPSVSTLIAFRYNRHHTAPRGRHGEGSNKTGRSGEDLIVRVPAGTVVLDEDASTILADLDQEGSEWIAARGGRGGRGNARFSSSTNRAPTRHDPGEDGQERRLRLELKLLADVGLVGLPNAGKSTLISRISAAKPKIADYPFTTLEPHLGVVDAGDERSFVVADIPGLIEGAHRGAGLGDRFLRHVERCSLLLHLVDATDPTEDPLQAIAVIDGEIAGHRATLQDKPQILVATKADALQDPAVLARLEARAAETGRPFLTISAVTGQGLDRLIAEVATHVDRERTSSRRVGSSPEWLDDPEVVGVLGGTFDPVHRGHIELAAGVRERTGLGRVLLMPGAMPPHKRPQDLTCPEHREAMLRLAIAGRDGIDLSTIELESGKVCYTIDTLRGMKNAEPPQEPVFVLGMDSLHDLPSWKQYRALIEEFDLIVVDRPGSPGPATPLDAWIERRLVEVEQPPEAGRRQLRRAGIGSGGRVFHIRLPPIPVSSSEIRERIAGGLPFDDLVGPAVAGYISSHGLYDEEVVR